MKISSNLLLKTGLVTSAILLALLAPTIATAKTPKKSITPKTLPDAKRQIAREIISCFHDDGPLAEGTAWDNVCYGNAAESFLELARHYAKQYLTDKDYSNDENIADRVKTDQKYFESQVSSCEAFPSEIGAEYVSFIEQGNMQNILIEQPIKKYHQTHTIRNLKKNLLIA